MTNMKNIILSLLALITFNSVFSQVQSSKQDKIIATLSYLVGKNYNLKDENDSILYTTEYQGEIQKTFGHDLNWFFDAYCSQTQLPNLLINHKNDTLYLEWSTPSEFDFEMPLDILIKKKASVLDMKEGKSQLFVRTLGI